MRGRVATCPLGAGWPTSPPHEGLPARSVDHATRGSMLRAQGTTTSQGLKVSRCWEPVF